MKQDKRDFLSLLDFSPEELQYVIRRSKAMRQMHEAGTVYQPLTGKIGALILEMNSTRTRVAFEAGMAQLGGHVIFLSSQSSQLSRGEPIDDMARIIARASGNAGTNFEYLKNTVDHLDELGIADGPLHDLLRRVERLRG